MTLVRDAGRSPPRWGKIALIVVAVILAIPIFSPIIFRTFLFQPFYIPAGSMMPTVLVGDSLFVSKYAYGYSRYSLPLSPRLFSGRIFGSVPERGDVIVFRMPKNDSVDYIKRIVGLPGDTVQMQQGLLFIMACRSCGRGCLISKVASRAEEGTTTEPGAGAKHF